MFLRSQSIQDQRVEYVLVWEMIMLVGEEGKEEGGEEEEEEKLMG